MKTKVIKVSDLGDIVIPDVIIRTLNLKPKDNALIEIYNKGNLNLTALKWQ